MDQLSLFDKGKTRSLSHVHSSKRGKRERQGVHAWHPYYAGYSEQFVVDVLQCLSEPSDIVLDPWNGSGTTTFASQKMGRLSIGIEINPVMTIHARAKSLQLVKKSQELRALRNKLIEIASRSYRERTYRTDSLSIFASAEVIDILLSLRDTVFSKLVNINCPKFTQAILTKNPRISYGSDIQSFFLSAIFRVFRKVGNFEKGSNPTWLKIKNKVTTYSQKDILNIFNEIVEDMIEDLSRSLQDEYKANDFLTINGDSCQLPIKDCSIDLVITSPPYCTRIDYAVSTKPELLLLGFTDEQFDTLRRATTGAPVIVDKTIEKERAWGSTCNHFLAEVSQHNSKASRSYYLPNYLQYFRDIFVSMKEICRVIKDSGKAAIVVQSSYFKDIELPLGEIYKEMGLSLGMKAEIARREIVKQHMAHINSKSKEYVKNKIYFEDVVLIIKSGRMFTMSDRSIYSNHSEQRELALPPAKRVEDLQKALVETFGDQIEYREVPFILFDQVHVETLAEAFYKHPIIIKSILACVNVAQRAVKRDLGIDIDTYTETISKQKAAILSGYVKPMLPRELAVPALLMLDHYFWVDKEMRATKGRWEQKISKYLNKHGNVAFKKRKFKHEDSSFELDAAYPSKGVPISIGVDVKRFESERDYHKRGDEITQKANHLKSVYPESKFYAVIYYPFPSKHENVRRRYANQGIDGIYFAGETDELIEEAAVNILEDCDLLS